MPLTKNSEHLAEITGYTGDGAGVARIDGQVVFIPGTITGELCRVKILNVSQFRFAGHTYKAKVSSAAI